MGKSSKATSVEIHGQWVVGGAKSVDTHIELPSPEEQRIEDVPLANIVLNRYFLVGALPFIDLANFVEDENAFALAPGGLG